MRVRRHYRLTPKDWAALSPDEQIELLAEDAYIASELRRVVNEAKAQHKEHKAPIEVALPVIFWDIGLYG